MPLQFSSLQFWSWSIDLLRKHRESYVWYCFFNLIMLENRAQMPKTLQIFSYGSVYSYSRMLYHQHGLCSAELRRTQRFISKCTVMNVFLEMLSYGNSIVRRRNSRRAFSGRRRRIFVVFCLGFEEFLWKTLMDGHA